MEQFLGEEPASTEWIIIAQAADIRSLQLPTSVLGILSLPRGGGATTATATTATSATAPTPKASRAAT